MKSLIIESESCNPCPKCKQTMQRRKHRPEWKPKENQPYYFDYWDYCVQCAYTQHYEIAKRYIVSDIDPLEMEFREIMRE